MARRSRQLKTDKKGYGRPHREHRSKKGRTKRSHGDRAHALERRQKIEELRLKDLD